MDTWIIMEVIFWSSSFLVKLLTVCCKAQENIVSYFLKEHTLKNFVGYLQILILLFSAVKQCASIKLEYML